jgi:hypothetical protein
MVRIQLSPARVRLLATAMIAGPILILFGHLFTVSADQEPADYISGIAALGPMAYYATAVAIGVGALLLLFWVAGALLLTPGRGGVLTTIGAVLATIGIIPTGAGNFMFGAVMASLVPADQGVARRVAEIADTQLAAGLGWQLMPLMIIGVILIGVGFIRARTVPLWLSIVLIVGSVLVTFSGAGGVMTFLLLLPWCVGLAGVAVVLWRRAAAPASAPEIASEGALAAAH